MPKGVYTRQTPNYNYLLNAAKEHGMQDSCLLWPFCVDNKNGYGRLRLNGADYRVNRLSLEYKLGRPISEGLYSLHTHSGNRSCFAFAHLYEGSARQNSDDMVYRDATQFKKIADADVLKIIEQYKSGFFTQPELADIYNVHNSEISRIINAKRRLHQQP